MIQMPPAPVLSRSRVQPILPAIETIAAHCDSCSAWRSKTIRTARSRTSGEYFGTVFMTPYPLKIWSLRQTRGGSISCETGGEPPEGEYQMARSVNFVAMGQLSKVAYRSP